MARLEPWRVFFFAFGPLYNRQIRHHVFESLLQASWGLNPPGCIGF